MATPFLREPEREAGMSGKVLLLAAGAVLLVVATLAVVTLRRAPTDNGAAQPPASYAANLPISGVELSEATNGTGGKVTYIDGTIQNTGTRTLTGAIVQLTFPVDDGSAPQRASTALTLIRTRQPYVDLEPVGAEPLKPGDSHEFRLILETVPANWNTQPPDIRVIRTDLH